MSVNLLSSEIMVMIFSYLKPTELQNVMKVCHRWRRLATDRKLWNRTSNSYIECYGKSEWMHFNWGNRFSVDEFLWLCKHGVKINRLHLGNCSAQETKSVINSCVKYEIPLAEIHLNMSTEIDWESVNDLAISPVGTNITDMYICTSTALPSLYHFAKFPNLRTFNYWGSGNELLQVLATHFCSLIAVHLNEEEFSNLEIKKMLHNIKGLKRVEFNTCCVEEDIGFQAFSGNQTIEEIEVKHTEVIDDRSRVRFIDYRPLVTLPNLKTLSFDFTRTKYSTLELMKIAARSITSLDFRDLPDDSDQYNTDELLAVIARRFPDLHTLTIQLNCGTDSGLFVFLNEAMKLRKLVVDNSGDDYFSIFGKDDPDFRKLTGDKWSNIIGTHQTLKELDLYQCTFLTKENLDIVRAGCISSGIKLRQPYNSDDEI